MSRSYYSCFLLNLCLAIEDITHFSEGMEQLSKKTKTFLATEKADDSDSVFVRLLKTAGVLLKPGQRQLQLGNYFILELFSGSGVTGFLGGEVVQIRSRRPCE